jgi:hypothetical protein
MFPWKIVRKGFLLAPLLPCVLLLVEGFAEGQVYGLAGAALHALFLYFYCVLACYVISLVAALPLYCLAWRYFRVSWLSCMVGAGLVGGVPAWFFFALQYFGRWPKWDNDSLGGVPLIVNQQFTAAGLEHYFMTGVYSALFGAAIGFAFWWVAVRKHPPAQSKVIALLTA